MTFGLETVWSTLIDVTIKSSLIVLLAWLCGKVWCPPVAILRKTWVGASYVLALIALTSLTTLARWNVPMPVASAPSYALPESAGHSGLPAETVLLGLWALVSFLLLATYIAAHLHVRNVLRHCAKVEVPVQLMERLRAVSGVRRPWRLLAGGGSVGPFTCGTWAPAVVLPEDWHTWPESRLRAVLLHELSHVRAVDFPAQNLAVLFCCVQWFNPLAWLALSNLRNACEAAADDAVLQGGVSACDYAEALVAVAAMGRGSIRAAALPFRSRRLPQRIAMLLDNARNPRRTPRAHSYAVGSALFVLALALTAVRVSAGQVSLFRGGLNLNAGWMIVSTFGPAKSATNSSISAPEVAEEAPRRRIPWAAPRALEQGSRDTQKRREPEAVRDTASGVPALVANQNKSLTTGNADEFIPPVAVAIQKPNPKPGTADEATSPERPPEPQESLTAVQTPKSGPTTKDKPPSTAIVFSKVDGKKTETVVTSGHK